VHGSIGRDLFSKYVATIDYDARTASFEEPNAFSYSGAGVTLPVTTPRRLPVVRAQIVTRTRGVIDANLILDLGSANYAMRLSTPFVASHGLDQDTITIAGPFGAGVGSVSAGCLTRFPELTLGTLTIARPSTALSQSADGAFGNNAQSDGTIGVPVFRRVRMIVDLPHDRVILEPTHRLDVADSVDASGVSFVADANAPGALRVSYVVAGSAGAQAGVQVGDEVVRIDGKPVSSLQVYQARELMRTAGRTCHLSLRRDGRAMDVSFTLVPVL
jgi:hypothetical protein